MEGIVREDTFPPLRHAHVCDGHCLDDLFIILFQIPCPRIGVHLASRGQFSHRGEQLCKFHHLLLCRKVVPRGDGPSVEGNFQEGSREAMGFDLS